MNDYPPSPPTLTIIHHGSEAIFQWQPHVATFNYSMLVAEPEMESRLQTLNEMMRSIVPEFYYAQTTQFSGAKEIEKAEQLQRLGEQIYALLPRPLRNALTHASVIMPVGAPLLIATNDSSIPWELAWDGQEFWGTRWSISRTFVLAANEEIAVRPFTAGNEKRALLIGNPTDDLPDTHNELDNLYTRLYEQGYQPNLLLSTTATRTELLKELRSGRYHLIHYAGHATVAGNGESALVLYNHELLTASEITAAIHGSPWVILNACASAHNDSAPRQTQSTNGLAQAFLAGGAAVVIATRWAIPDQAASVLSNALYDQLFRRVAVGEALRTTRLQVKEKHPADPVWASYVLYALPNLRLPVDDVYKRLPHVTVLHLRLNLQSVQPSSDRWAKAHDLAIEHIITHVKELGGKIVSSDAYQTTALFAALPWNGDNQPQHGDDPTERALTTAFYIRQTLPRLFAASPHFSAITAHVAIGLATDSAMFNQQNQRLTGSACEAARWLSEQALPGEILIGPTAIRSGRRRYQIEVWQGQPSVAKPAALATATIQKVLDISDEFNFGPLIGREEELTDLCKAWQQTQKGQSHLFSLNGEDGIGKSHIVYEFRQWLLQQTINPIYIQCLPQPVSSESFLLTTLVRLLLGINNTIPATSSLLQQCFGSTEGISESRLQRSIEALCPLLGVKSEKNENLLSKESNYPNFTHVVDSLSTALTTLFTAKINQSTSLTLIFEDLQYADPTGLSVLAKVFHNCRSLPIFCLAVQPATRSPAWPFSSAKEIRPFSLTDVAKLVQYRFDYQLSVDSAEQITHWTQGNPLFVLELMQWLIQHKWLIKVDNSWQLQNTIATPQIPRTIHGILQNRLEGLHPELRQILEELAPLGMKFPEELSYKLLQQSSDRDLWKLETQLFQLEDYHFIQLHQTSIAFQHALTHKAVLLRLNSPQRRQSHRRIAHLWKLEGSTERSLREYANHLYFSVCEFSQGHIPMLAPESANQNDLFTVMQTQIQTGEQAQRQYNYDAALIYFQRAYEIALGIRIERYQIADLARRIGRLYMLCSQHIQALEWMQKGLHTLDITTSDSLQFTSTQERQIAALLFIHTASIYYSQDAYPEAVRNCQRGLQLVTPPESEQDRRCLAEGSNILGAILDAQGQSQQALQHYQDSQIIWAELGDEFELNRARSNMSSAYFALGHWDDSLTLDQQAFVFWDKFGDLRRKGLAALNVGMIQLLRGEWEAAEQHFAIGRTACETSTDYRHVALAHTNLGLLKLATGQLDAAARLFAQSQMVLQSYPTHASPEPLYGLSEVALRQGNIAEAKQLAADALNLSRDAESQIEECISHRCLGLAYLADNQILLAEASLQASLQLAETAELKFEIGRTSLAIGILYTHMKRKSEASSHLERALAIFKELRAIPWLQQTTTAQEIVSKSVS